MESEMSVGEKAMRVMVFLMGLRLRAIAVALSAFGLTAEERERGWTLFQSVVRGKLGGSAGTNPRIVSKLDEWENLWFPVISASLRARHPETYDLVFRNLSQASGLEVVVVVRTLIERLDLLVRPTSEGGLGEAGAAAMSFLATRGVTTEKLAEGRALLTQLGSPEPVTAGTTERSDEEEEAAEKAMWAWYLEWSEIARAVITNRRHLRSLGFLKNERGEVVDDPNALDPAGPTPPAPVTPSPVNGGPFDPGGPFLPDTGR
jgi:hypothetical protein